MSLAVQLRPDSLYRRADPADFTVASAFNLQTAGAMAWLSQLTYEELDGEIVARVLEDWRLTRLATLRSPKSEPLDLVDTNGLVVTSPNATIIAFAGTDPFVGKDWLTDLNTRPSDDHIHSGFQNGVQSVWSQIQTAVKELAPPQLPVFVTGHSLGGALAVVAAKFLLKCIGVQAAGVYTFGMPRCLGSQIVGDYENALGARTYRLVHGHDVVPMLPPSELNFHHVGCLLQCKQEGKFDASHLSAAPSDQPSLVDFLNSFTSIAISELETIFGHLTALQVLALPGKITELIALMTSGLASPPTQPGLLGEIIALLPPPIRDHVPAQYLHALGFDLNT
jgi:Lipase (class 3)